MRNPALTSFPDTDAEYIREQARALKENVPYTKEDEARDRIKDMWKHWPWTVPVSAVDLPLTREDFNNGFVITNNALYDWLAKNTK